MLSYSGEPPFQIWRDATGVTRVPGPNTRPQSGKEGHGALCWHAAGRGWGISAARDGLIG